MIIVFQVHHLNHDDDDNYCVKSAVIYVDRVMNECERVGAFIRDRIAQNSGCKQRIATALCFCLQLLLLFVELFVPFYYYFNN